MIPKALRFISFSPGQKDFRGSLSLEAAFEAENDPQTLIRKSERVYKKYIGRMRHITEELKKKRANHISTPASEIWLLGNNIFTLKKELENFGLQVDGLYEHLVRDLNVKRKWLEKVVILRRYIPGKNLIPKASKWGMFEKGTAKKAKALKEPPA